MIYNYILFQIKVNNTYYLGKFILNILNYSVYNYSNKESTLNTYIEKWFNLVYKDYFENVDENIESNVVIILLNEKIDNIEKIYVDITINQQDKSICFKDKQNNLTNYDKIFKLLNKQSDTNLDLDIDYEDDELEYILDNSFVSDKVEEAFGKYLDKNGNYKKKYLREIKELEEKEENQDKCLEEILFEKFEKEYLEKYKYILDENFKKSKIENVNKRLEILEYIINKYHNVNKSLHNYCLEKYCTQLIRKYKYTDDNLEKIRYNFIVTSLNVKNSHEYSEINIYFSSNKSNVKGEGKYIEGGNYKSGTYTNISSNINDKDNNIDFDDIGEKLIDYITYQMRYIKKV
jgi:hypothetical protein